MMTRRRLRSSRRPRMPGVANRQLHAGTGASRANRPVGVVLSADRAAHRNSAAWAPPLHAYLSQMGERTPKLFIVLPAACLRGLHANCRATQEKATINRRKTIKVMNVNPQFVIHTNKRE